MSRLSVKIRTHDPSTLYPKYLGDAHAVEVSGASRMLFVSGLNGYEVNGKTMPETFEEQCDMIWSHLLFDFGVRRHGK